MMMDDGDNMRGTSPLPPCGKGGLGAWTMMMMMMDDGGCWMME